MSDHTPPPPPVPPPLPHGSSPYDAAAGEPPPRDELDGLLRQWHAQNAERAAAGRDRLMVSLAAEDAGHAAASPPIARDGGPVLVVVRRIIMNRYSPLVAAMLALAVALPFFWPAGPGLGGRGIVQSARAELPSNMVLAPEGGRLDAVDARGRSLGPCALERTDVSAEISGRFSRVTVRQTFRNGLPEKIEAVYTFPLSHRAGVDRMTMTIGDRTILGEVKERGAARRVYEAARQQGRVAGLLEQERPNIFTQSVANIEPGAKVEVEISYVELIDRSEGAFRFSFPTVVGPRYIPGPPLSPGASAEGAAALPGGLRWRRGLVLEAPATVEGVRLAEGAADAASPAESALAQALASATPVDDPAPRAEDGTGTEEAAGTGPAPAWAEFTVAYPDGSKESGVVRGDGTGSINGRGFYAPALEDFGRRAPAPAAAPPAEPGAPFSPPTARVPDADRITPAPVRPATRAGHDLSIDVTIDTGGPGIVQLESPLHAVTRTDVAPGPDGSARRVRVRLAGGTTIPNKDFVLAWRQADDRVAERVFAHNAARGGFFAVQLEPPARVAEAQAVPRELVFVVDTSGSMNGRPISLCKRLIHEALDTMRSADTFNLITFAGDTRILWGAPRPNTPQNRAEAQRFLDGHAGSGGTEMMAAINAALSPMPRGAGADAGGRTGASVEGLTPAELADLPADGREVVVIVPPGGFVVPRCTGCTRIEGISVRPDLNLRVRPVEPPALATDDAEARAGFLAQASTVVRGRWVTENGDRLLDVASMEYRGAPAAPAADPLRLVMFLTDAYVGNDLAIIDAIKRNRGTTRVFSFGVGNSVNRYLIDGMARAGGGEAEYVYVDSASEDEAKNAVTRFNRRTRTPVLADIRVQFQGVEVADVLPDPANIPDLFDDRPVTLVGRYTHPGAGRVVMTGRTAAGPWRSEIALDLPARSDEHSSLPTLWARARIDDLTGLDLAGIQQGRPNPDVRAQIVRLGETFGVMSPFTSFVATETTRVTIGGKARQVRIPIELPDGTNWDGFFGPAGTPGQPEGGVRGRDADLLSFRPAALERMLSLRSATANTAVMTRPTFGTSPGVDARFVAAAPAAAAPPRPSKPLADSGSDVSGYGSADKGGRSVPRTLPNIVSPALAEAEKATPPPVPPAGRSLPPPTAKPRPAPADRAGKSTAPADSRLDATAARTPAPLAKPGGPASRADKPETGDRLMRMRPGTASGVSGDADGERDSDAGAHPDAGDAALAPMQVLAAAQLAESGKLDEARTLACGPWAEEGPASALAARLCAAIAEGTKAEERSLLVGAIRREASQSLLDLRREGTLRRKLDEALWARLRPADAGGPAMVSQSGAPAAPGRPEVKAGETVLVSVLVRGADGPTVEALAKAGANVEAVKKDVDVVIVRIGLDRLEALALMEAVRRVELVE